MQTILNQLKIKADIVATEVNGNISKYYIRLAPGTKVSKIENCATEIALGIKAHSKPIIRILSEKGLVCIELLTKSVGIVNFNSFDNYFVENRIYDYGDLPIILGRTHDGQDLITDLSLLPHLLVAGTTGSGKSVLLHSIISSIIKSSADTKLALIDPKKVELTYYSNINNLMYPVVTEENDALDILSDLVEEMQTRFKLLGKAEANNVNTYNKLTNKFMPYIVLVIDEFSDLMQSSKKIFQSKLCILAQKSRACGIHIIISTQRPSVDVVTGLIKANFPARISCKVSSLVDSRVVLDRPGAERLLGRGDALINANGLDMVRFQGSYITVDEIQNLCAGKQRTKLFNFLDYF